MSLTPCRHLMPDSVRLFARRARRARSRLSRLVAGLEPLEVRQLLATFTVINTADNGNNSSPTPGSLRAAIVASNNATPGPNDIVFDIPASTAPNLDVPVPGFDPVTQDWTITLASALPPITTTVDIDGFTQAHLGTPFRYPVDFSSQSDSLAVDPSVIGGTYQLTIAPYTDRSGVVRSGTTANIPYDASAAFVQDQLEGIVGNSNVAVTSLGLPTGPGAYSIAFQGESTGLDIAITVSNEALIATGLDPNPAATIAVSSQGGTPSTAVTEISSAPNTLQAVQGNNAQVRVIVDGQPNRRGHRLRARHVERDVAGPGHRRLRHCRLGASGSRRRQPDPGGLSRQVSRLPGRSDYRRPAPRDSAWNMSEARATRHRARRSRSSTSSGRTRRSAAPHRRTTTSSRETGCRA